MFHLLRCEFPAAGRCWCIKENRAVCNGTRIHKSLEGSEDQDAALGTSEYSKSLVMAIRLASSTATEIGAEPVETPHRAVRI